MYTILNKLEAICHRDFNYPIDASFEVEDKLISLKIHHGSLFDDVEGLDEYIERCEQLKVVTFNLTIYKKGDLYELAECYELDSLLKHLI